MIKIHVTLNVIYKEKKVRQKSGLVERVVSTYAVFLLVVILEMDAGENMQSYLRLTCHNIIKLKLGKSQYIIFKYLTETKIKTVYF